MAVCIKKDTYVFIVGFIVLALENERRHQTLYGMIWYGIVQLKLS